MVEPHAIATKAPHKAKTKAKCIDNTYVAVLFFYGTKGVACKLVVTSTDRLPTVSYAEPEAKKTYNTRSQEEKKAILELVDWLQLTRKLGVAKAVCEVRGIHAAFKSVDEKSIREWRAIRDKAAAAGEDELPVAKRGRPHAVPEAVRAKIKEKVCNIIGATCDQTLAAGLEAVGDLLIILANVPLLPIPPLLLIPFTEHIE
jgi:hypothetical protein